MHYWIGLLSILFIYGISTWGIVGSFEDKIDVLIQERDAAIRLHQQCRTSSKGLSAELDEWRSEAILCWRQHDVDCKVFEDE